MISKNNSIYLSVVIPVYNEEIRLGPTLDIIIRYLDTKGYAYEIIIVDDGSEDKTAPLVADIAKNFTQVSLLRNLQNKGKGYAVKRGIKEARGQYVLFLDADLSTPIQEVDRCIKYLTDNFDIAIGSRSLNLGAKIEKRQKFYRERLGYIFSLIQRFILKTGIDDTQCGFKCFRVEAAKNIFSRQRLDRFSFDAEILFIARKLGYRIKEMPITWKNDFASKVKLLLDGSRMLVDLLVIRYNYLRGLYNTKIQNDQL